MAVLAAGCSSSSGNADPAPVTATAPVTTGPTAPTGPAAGSDNTGTIGATSVAGRVVVSDEPTSAPAGSSGQHPAPSNGSGAAAPSSAAVSSAPSSSAPSSSALSSSAQAKPKPVATISSTPALGSTNISPVTPITVTVGKGTITTIDLVNPSGYHVKGKLSGDKKSWTTAEVLGYGKKYTLTGSATGADGKAVPIKGSYTVVTPKNEVRTTVYPSDGMQVGVAMPIIVKFPFEPEDKALIEKNVSVTTTPKVEGSWGWVKHDADAKGNPVWGLDFRPRTYWPEGTKVHVSAQLYGLRFGAGAYGKTDITSDFTIGRNQVVKADARTHKIVVERDGRPVATYNASYGQETDTVAGHDPKDRQTKSGVHVVNDMKEDTVMRSPLFNYAEKEKWAVRISNNGEFIHANPNTINEQGKANVSHGCINLSLADAEAYFKTAMIGDPVEVTGTDVTLGPADGDIFDWTYSYSQWKDFSAAN
nr:Ig-like domain-containing protein [Nakamurella aerolata]